MLSQTGVLVPGHRGHEMQSSELLAEVALGLIGHGSLDERMNMALEKIGLHLGVSRAYVFLDRPGNAITDNTHEWCASGVEAQRESLQGIEYAGIPTWRGMLERDGRILATDISTLARDIRAILEPQDIQSLLVLPLHIQNVMAGFMGFDQCGTRRGWEVEELSVLRTVASVVSTVMERDIDRRLLANSEANFRQFFDTIDDLIVVADPEGRLVYANGAVHRTLGYSSDELVAMPLLEMHPADRREEAGRIVAEMLRRERDTCPLELLRKDGTRLAVETRVWFGPWNGQECLFGISKDLSAEQARLQMFTRLFSENPAPMALSGSADGRFEDVNAAFLERLGYQRGEVVGKTGLDLKLFIHPAQRRRFGDELVREGSISNVEMDIRCKDGRIVRGLFSGGMVENQGRRLFLTVMIDISEQAELRDRLESQRRRLSNIIDSSRLGTWEWNLSTGETIFNERWAGMLGFSLSELEPTTIDTWKRLILPTDYIISEAHLARHFAGETEFYEFEGRMRHKDGRIVHVLDRGKVIERDGHGKPLRMFGTHQDITDRKELEEKLRKLSCSSPVD